MYGFRQKIKGLIFYRDLILGHSLTGMDVHYLSPNEDELKKAIKKHTQWLDVQVAETHIETDKKSSVS